MTVTGDPARNLAQLTAMADELERYLERGRPYASVVADWPGGGKQTVTLSLGLIRELVDALDRDAARLDARQRASFEQARAAWRGLRASRAPQYAAMLRHELQSQLDSWRWFIDDVAGDDEPAADCYPREVGRRLRIQELLEEAATVGAEVDEARARSAALDEELRRHFEAGAYCGPAGRSGRFGPVTHWWLYGRPRAHGGH